MWCQMARSSLNLLKQLLLNKSTTNTGPGNHLGHTKKETAP